MAKTFLELKTNVCNDINDTSDHMMGLVGVYLNTRYKYAFLTYNWDYIKDDYTIAVTAGTQDYNLPADFNKELYVIDSNNALELNKISVKDISKNYASRLTEQNTLADYCIFNKDDGTRKIRFLPIPANDTTVVMPYIAEPVNMSSDTDTPILNLDYAIELGAKADAWRYKKQFAKAQQFEVLYVQAVENIFFANVNHPNEVHVFNVKPYSRDIV